MCLNRKRLSIAESLYYIKYTVNVLLDSQNIQNSLSITKHIIKAIMQGWIKLHRKLLTSDMMKYLTSTQVCIMVRLLLMSNHKKSNFIWNGKLIELEAGQFITSVQKIKENCPKDVSIRQIRTCLEVLKIAQFLTIKTTNKYTLLTICNWSTYQDRNLEDDKVIDKQTTNKRQTNDNIQEVKNLKNGKNRERELPLSIEAYMSLNAEDYLNNLERKQLPAGTSLFLETRYKKAHWVKSLDSLETHSSKKYKTMGTLKVWLKGDETDTSIFRATVDMKKYLEYKFKDDWKYYWELIKDKL